jgi:threonine dehydrogenase-like Zn-dependent dehydrogenase
MEEFAARGDRTVIFVLEGTLVKQAFFRGGSIIEVVNGPEPVVGPGEVLIEVERCALCGSDLSIYKSGHPRIPGHEIVGFVRQEGHRLNGKRVGVYIPVWCGHCEECTRGNTHCCETQRILVGWSTNGGYAEGLSVPEQCLLPISEQIPADLAPLLLDAIGTTSHGIRLAKKVTTLDRCLIIGAGPIGLGSILVLQAMGGREIHCAEINAFRLQKAIEFGAAPLTADEARRFDVVIEASGSEPGRQKALELTRPGGACVFLGESNAQWKIVENRELQLKDFFLIRSFYFPIADFAENEQMLLQHAVSFRRLVDAEATIDDLPNLFAAFARGEHLKPMMISPR